MSKISFKLGENKLAAALAQQFRASLQGNKSQETGCGPLESAVI